MTEIDEIERAHKSDIKAFRDAGIPPLDVLDRESALIAKVRELEKDKAGLCKSLLQAQDLGWQWMVAHDSLVAGVPYDTPSITRPITPLQAAKDAFIEAYRVYRPHADINNLLALERAWNHLQQIEANAMMEESK